MEAVSQKEGRTVVIVSHQMNIIKALCQSCIWMDGGQIKQHSTNVSAVVANYYELHQTESPTHLYNQGSNDYFQINSFRIINKQGQEISYTGNNEDVYVCLSGTIYKWISALEFGIILYDEEGQILFMSYHYDMAENYWPVLKEGPFSLKALLPQRMLNEGKYTIQLIAGLKSIRWYFGPGAVNVYRSLSIVGGLSDSPIWHEKRQGVLAPVLHWTNT